MLEGLYSAAAGMTAQQQRLDALSNDIANVSTAGYQGQRLAFRDLAYAEEPAGAAPGVRAGAGAAMTAIGRTTAQGALQPTGRSLDVALAGDGFISVRRADGGDALTRSGALTLSTNRELVTPSGDRVQPPVRVPQDVDPDDLTIAADGTVSAAGRRLGRVGVVEVPAKAGLQPLGDNLFATTAASGAARPARETAVTQGVLEASNVDMSVAMTELMEAQRAYSMASRAIQNADQQMEIANGVKR